MLPTSPWIIRAETVQAHSDAASVRSSAKAEAALIVEQAQADRRTAISSGFAEGLQAGTAQAAQLASDTALATEEFLSNRAADLHDLALAIAHRVLTSLPADEVLARLAADAVAEYRADVQLTLRVSAGDAGPLRAALAVADPTGRVAVVADATASPGSCTLVHPRGRTRIGLLEQFRALMGSGA